MSRNLLETSRMNHVDPASGVASSPLLATLAETPTDSSGVQTFARYLWQAKQAVRLWLTCLSTGPGPAFVVCEHVEDIVLVYPTKIRFLQLKTRDRGSWSARNICDDGLDSLTRSYSQAQQTSLHRQATFELWLEGPIANGRESSLFVTDPKQASPVIRKRLLAIGAQPEWLDDFLARLVIKPNQPTQAHIDATAIRELACLWHSLSKSELDYLYDALLQAATAAQGAQPQPAITQAHIAAALDNDPGHEAEAIASNVALDPIRNQILSRETLIAITPPQPVEPAEQILARIGQGSGPSALELKMTIAGALEETIRETKDLRAQMEFRRQLLLASRQTAERDLERLAQRVLTVANATARTIKHSATTNPVAGSRSAEVIAAQLLSHPTELGSLDDERLFQGDGLAVFGFLCHLSDMCLYPWRAA